MIDNNFKGNEIEKTAKIKLLQYMYVSLLKSPNFNVAKIRVLQYDTCI